MMKWEKITGLGWQRWVHNC